MNHPYGHPTNLTFIYMSLHTDTQKRTNLDITKYIHKSE